MSSAKLKAALAVWHYCEESALRLFGGDTLALRIRSYVQMNAGCMKSEIRKSLSHTIATDAFDNALRWLIERNEIVCVPCYEQRQADRYFPAITGYTDLGDGVQENEKPISLNPAFRETKTMSLTELFDWINENGIRFVRNADALVWVSDDHVDP